MRRVERPGDEDPADDRPVHRRDESQELLQDERRDDRRPHARPARDQMRPQQVAAEMAGQDRAHQPALVVDADDG
jgi:hypothetical protein